jgi:nitrite reductase/ring-hydroxylating ferredoxin subunit
MRLEVAKAADVLEGGAKCITAYGRPYALFMVQGHVFCLANECTHLGGPLCEGRLLDGTVVQCPWHGSRFDVRSGQVVGPPARTPVRAYPAGISDGAVWIEVP